MNPNLKYQIALTQLFGVGDKISKVLLSEFKTVEAIFSASKKDLSKVNTIGNKLVDKILDSKPIALEKAEKELKFLEKHPEIKTLFFTDKDFPNRLKYCEDSPILLYTHGKMNLNAQRVISIVGTRKITDYGRKLIKDFIYELKDAQVVVISGLAYGVDTFVHQTCVEMGIETTGILAHGLDTLYPASNKNLVKKMVLNGGLATEYLTETIPNRENFPARNRIVAGLADATIIIESDTKGGSLITAEIALSYNRDVFAFPGRVNDQFSSGCNTLIKRQKALLIENAKDLFYHLGWQEQEKKIKSRQRQLFVSLDDKEQLIANILQKENLNAQQISVKSSLPMSEVRTILLNLELKGVVRIAPGNQFALN